MLGCDHRQGVILPAIGMLRQLRLVYSHLRKNVGHYNIITLENKMLCVKKGMIKQMNGAW